MIVSVSTAGIACALALGFTTSLGAQVSSFVGTWRNIDSRTRTLTTLRIENFGKGQLRVHAWAKCTPSDCAWGAADGVVYGPSLRSDVEAAAQVVSARFVMRASEKLLIIHAEKDRRLSVELLTRYTDQSARSNISEVVTLIRASDRGDVRVDSASPKTWSTHLSSAMRQWAPQCRAPSGWALIDLLSTALSPEDWGSVPTHARAGRPTAGLFVTRTRASRPASGAARPPGPRARRESSSGAAA